MTSQERAMEIRATFLKLAMGALALSSFLLVSVTPGAVAHAQAGKRETA